MKYHGIFKTSCPPGWTRQNGWNDRFIYGSINTTASNIGLTGGSSATHTHTGNTTAGTTAIEPYSVNNLCPSNVYYPISRFHTHSVAAQSFTTDAAQYEPPYYTVVFCYVEL